MSFVDDAVSQGKNVIRRRVLAPARDAYWRVYGRQLKNPDFLVRPASCLFLCKGNICRSPFAERIARKIAAEMKLRDMALRSAGFDVTTSLRSPEQAVQAARRFGVTLDDHQSAPLTNDLIGGSDMIFVMEAAHLARLRSAYPSRRGSFFLLPLFRDGLEPEEGHFERYNIGDPYGGELDLFVTCYGRIARCVEQLIADIEKGDERK